MIVLGILITLSNRDMTVVGGMVVAPDEAGELIGRLLQHRIEFGLTSIILLLGIVTVLARIFPAHDQARAGGEVAISWIKYPGATGFVLLLIGMGLVLTLFPEFLYLKDNFGVRINTVFKFYYQAWVLWSIATAYALYSIMADASLPLPHPLLRMGFALALALSAVAGLAYSIEAVYHRSMIETGRHRYVDSRYYAAPAEWDKAVRRVGEGQWVEPGTILFSKASLIEAAESDLIRAQHEGIVNFQEDALTIEERLSIDGAKDLLFRDDQNAIECLSELVGRADVVVAEAVGEPYRIEYGRVGTLAGIPIVLGWENHERQWRGDTYATIAGTRHADIRRLYSAADMDEVDDIVNRYGINYILYGASERQKYGELGEDKFLDKLPVVCQSGRSRVYFTGKTLSH